MRGRRVPLPWRKDVVILSEDGRAVGLFATQADERHRHVATFHGWAAEENVDLVVAVLTAAVEYDEAVLPGDQRRALVKLREAIAEAGRS